MEEEPIMCKRIQRLLISLSMLMTLAFSQADVTLTLQSDGKKTQPKGLGLVKYDAPYEQ